MGSEKTGAVAGQEIDDCNAGNFLRARQSAECPAPKLLHRRMGNRRRFAAHASAILCVSAHWYFPATAVTAMSQPRTIHDFGGFPHELYQVEYPAPGSPELAQRVRELLAPVPVAMDQKSWGLDHGTWSVLCHVFPKADIPVVQLSIDETKPPEFHYQVAKV